MNKIASRLFCMLLVAISLVSCGNDKDEVLPAGYGQVSFELVRKNVYLVTKLDAVHTIKVTLTDPQGATKVLPSMELTGNEDVISTQPFALPAGNYIVQGYRCFDKQGNLIDELDITLTKANTFTVVAAQQVAMPLAVQVKQVLTSSGLYNCLYGLCMEVLGPDKSKWPKSWDFDGEGIDGSWAGLEFEWDVATDQPTELIGIVIDGEPQYVINSDTGERILVSLPEFRGMKKLPACIADFMNLDGISIRNCDMEELCPELEHSTITSLTIYNTHLREVPEELGNMRNLCDVWIEGNRLTSFPEAFTRCKNMHAFVLRDEAISSVPESIAAWGKNLQTMQITGTQIETLPDVFDRLWNVSMLTLDNNKNLSTLPPTIGMEKIPYADAPEHFSYTGITGLSLDGCAFTEVPAQACRPRLRYLSMCDNRLTQVNKADFDAMTDLQTLKLDGNQFSTFPALTNPQMAYLSLLRCGIKRSQVDISGMPRLSPQWFFCE